MNFTKSKRSLSPSPYHREKANVVLARKICYVDLFWVFMLGSVVGFVLEGLWHMLWHDGAWESHSATVIGPFCIVYGLGAVVMYVLALSLQGRSLLVQFALYSLVGALVEFEAGLFQELCFGSSSWNYSHQPLNVDGKISLQMSLIWGVLGVAFARFALPLLLRLLTRMQGRGWRVACGILSVLMAANLLLTTCAVKRWHDRQESLSAASALEHFLDRQYDDQKMSEIFPNMSFES